jgi:hypothetical protein
MASNFPPCGLIKDSPRLTTWTLVTLPSDPGHLFTTARALTDISCTTTS